MVVLETRFQAVVPFQSETDIDKTRLETVPDILRYQLFLCVIDETTVLERRMNDCRLLCRNVISFAILLISICSFPIRSFFFAPHIGQRVFSYDKAGQERERHGVFILLLHLKQFIVMIIQKYNYTMDIISDGMRPTALVQNQQRKLNGAHINKDPTDSNRLKITHVARD